MSAERQEHKETSIKVISFDGKRDRFLIWIEKYKAKSMINGRLDILTGSKAMPSKGSYDAAIATAEASRTVTQKSNIVDYRQGMCAYSDLILSMDTTRAAGKVAFEIVKQSKDVNHPEGSPNLAYENLTKKYEAKTAPNFIELEREFANSKLESDEDDPDEWITSLESLKTRMNEVVITGKTAKSEIDMILHILANLPESYEGQVSAIEKDLTIDPTTATIDKIRDTLNLRYARIQKTRDAAPKNDQERALSAISATMKSMNTDELVFFAKQFKGLCNKCGKFGHKGADCRNSRYTNNSAGNKVGEVEFHGKCFHCGVRGHMKADCKLWKEKQEQVNLAMGENEKNQSDESFDELGFVAKCGAVDQASIFSPNKRKVSFLPDVMKLEYDRNCGVTVSPKRRIVTLNNEIRSRKIRRLDAADNQEGLVWGLSRCLIGRSTEIDEMVLMLTTKESSMKNDETSSFCMIDGTRYASFDKNTFYGDTGSSHVMDTDVDGLYDAVRIDEKIGGYGGQSVLATWKGKKDYIANFSDGTTTTLMGVTVKVSENAGQKLFPLHLEKAARGGDLSTNSDGSLLLTYPGGDTIVCDRRLKTKDGWVSGVRMVPIVKDNNIALLAVGKAINVNQYHEELGHPSMATTRATAKAKDVRVKDAPKVCEDCLFGKARKKSVPKEKVEQSKTPGERLFIDISSPTQRSIGGNRHWLLILDDHSDKCFSFFLSHKDMLKTKMVPFIKKLRNMGIIVKIIRCDNAGENIDFEREANEKGLDLQFEYTAPDTPQQNGRVERKFQTLYGRVRAMIFGMEDFEISAVRKLWCEAAQTATDLDGYIVKEGDELSAYQKFFGKGNKSIVNTTKKFGQRCMNTNRGKIKAKLAKRGTVMHWLGYSHDHAVGTYRLYNPDTQRVIQSRDVTFLESDAIQTHDDSGSTSKVKTTDVESIIDVEKDAKSNPVELSQQDTLESKAEQIVKERKRKMNKTKKSARFVSDSESDDDMPQLIKGGDSSSSDDESKNEHSHRISRLNVRANDRAIVEDDESEDEDVVPPLIQPEDQESSDEEEISHRSNKCAFRMPTRSYVKQRTEREGRANRRSANRVAKDTQSKSQKMRRVAKQLETSYNPVATEIISQEEENQTKENESTESSNESNIIEDDNETGRETAAISIEQVSNDVYSYLCEVAQIVIVDPPKTVKSVDDYVEPNSYVEAWHHPDPAQRIKWRGAITKEYGDMVKRKVWEIKDRKEMPIERRCVKCKWVFKIKRNGVFRARLVACGYSQIPGVDFTDNYSPVVNDVTFRLILLLWIHFGLTAKIVDVETAFLYGKLDEEIYMQCPQGLKDGGNDKVLLLKQCIYGLVQAARQYYKHIVEILKEIGFKGGSVDPCLFTKRDKWGICFIVLYVDDNLIIGHPKAVEETISLMRKHNLVLKVEDELTDYLSCEIVMSDDRKKAWLGQPHLIANLEKKFGEEVANLYRYTTPGTAGMHQVRDENPENSLPIAKQEKYRSGVGMLLYLVKHSRPDIANAVRELSKVLDCSNMASYKEMLRCIKYVLNTRTYGLKLWPDMRSDKSWEIICFTDSDYASDPVTRRSVSGYIIYVHGVPVCWKSKAQRCVTLSSCEAEWIALSEAVKDIIFLIRLLESMQIKIVLPVTVRVDNVGAIFLSENITTSNNTKHVDIRSKFVKEYCENGTVKIIFVRSENNDSDIMTKNLGGVLHEKHANKLVGAKTA